MKCLNPQVRIKHTVHYHPSPSELNSKILSLIFLRIRIFFEFSLKLVYCTIVAEKVQIHGVKIIGKYICESKNWICLFLFKSLSKNFPQVLITATPGRRKFPPNNVFCIFPQQKGRIMELKKWTKVNLQGFWLQVLINSTIFGTITFLVSVLLYHNLDSSMLKCEGSLT